MNNIILNKVVVGDKTVVKYLMKQKGGNVTGCTSPESAMWMLTNDRSKKPRMAEEFAEYPLTADGVYFFDGKVEGDEGALSPADAGTSPSADGEAGDAAVAAELGADGLPLLVGAEKPKKRVKRTKDVVCE